MQSVAYRILNCCGYSHVTYYMFLKQNTFKSKIRSLHIWKRSVSIQSSQTHNGAIHHWLLRCTNAGVILGDRWNYTQAYVVSHRFHHSWHSYFMCTSELKHFSAVPIHCQMSVNIFPYWLSLLNVFPHHYSSVYRRSCSVCKHIISTRIYSGLKFRSGT